MEPYAPKAASTVGGRRSALALFTTLATDEGWLYLCTFIDHYSRMIVSWSIDSTMTASLIIDAFNLAKNRRIGQVSEIIHSDRGNQYASDAFRKALTKNHSKQSMSRKGNCGIMPWRKAFLHHQRWNWFITLTSEPDRKPLVEYLIISKYLIIDKGYTLR